MPKQMTTTKQDFACFSSRRNNFILVKFSTYTVASCGLRQLFNDKVYSCVSECNKDENKNVC